MTSTIGGTAQRRNWGIVMQVIAEFSWKVRHRKFVTGSSSQKVRHILCAKFSVPCEFLTLRHWAVRQATTSGERGEGDLCARGEVWRTACTACLNLPHHPSTHPLIHSQINVRMFQFSPRPLVSRRPTLTQPQVIPAPNRLTD